MLKNVKRLIFWLSIAVTAAAVIQQLRRSPEQRNWHGDVAGIPYDLRVPTLSLLKHTWWNPDDSRLFMPRAFGVGWDVNLHRALQLAGNAKRGGERLDEE